MDQSKEIYIRERRAYFWSVSDANLPHVSDELLVETILNYGTLEDVRALISLMGLPEVASVFFRTSGSGRRSNYFPEVANFFKIYFTRHVPWFAHVK